MSFVIADRIKETSTSTGTGAKTLAGAITGFKTFASRCAVGDTFYYAMQGVDTLGTPTGEWECGLGAYSATNELTPTTVTASSNADAAVNFSAGTKQVYITMPAVQVAWVRERLTAARTYYVRTDGVDTNTGLANTSGGAFLTIQKAIDVASDLDRSGFAVTIQVADGTYTGANVISGIVGNGSLTIQGNSGTPANVVISTTSSNCFSITGVTNTVTIKDLKVQNTTSGYGIFLDNAALSFTNIVFGACVTAHLRCSNGSSATATGNYSITGGATRHVMAYYGSRAYIIGKTITITGTPAFSLYFAEASASSLLYMTANTYSGSATGPYYHVKWNSAIVSDAQFPGNSAGSTASGGYYGT